MQTYTHGLATAAIGAQIFPHNAPLQAVCFFAGTIPDLPMVMPWFWDKLRGREPLVVQSRRLMLAKEMSHYVYVWLLILLISIAAFNLHKVSLMLAIFAFGSVSHILIDMFTHKEGPHSEHDCTYCWPFKNQTLYGFAKWDYRSEKAGLNPSTPEAIMCLTFCVILGCHWLT